MQVSNSHFPRPFPAGASTHAVKPDNKIHCMQHNINQQHFCVGEGHIVASCRLTMAGRSWYLLFSAFAASLGLALSSDLCYNHQTQTYDARFKPASNCEDMCTVTPYFSPDHSLDTYVSLIESATETIDIYTPGELQVGVYVATRLCACFTCMHILCMFLACICIIPCLGRCSYM